MSGMESNELDRAIELLGGVANAARVLPNVKSYQTVQQWRISGVPVEHCPSIEYATSGAVTCESLRDDVAWVRVADKSWPHPKGRPLVDHSVKLGAGETAQDAHEANVSAASSGCKKLNLKQMKEAA